MTLPIWTSFVTVAAVLVYIWTMAMSARARGRFKVPAPQISGPPEFERAFRVQQNTLEQIVMFLPALWLATYSIGDRWAALIGLVWVVGRIIYAVGYAQDPERRHLGFAIAFMATAVLLLAVLVVLLSRFF